MEDDIINIEEEYENFSRLFNRLLSDRNARGRELVPALALLSNIEAVKNLKETQGRKLDSLYIAYLDLRTRLKRPGVIEYAIRNTHQKIEYAIISVFIRDFSDIANVPYREARPRIKEYLNQAMRIRNKNPVYVSEPYSKNNREDAELYQSFQEIKDLKNTLSKISGVSSDDFQVNFSRINQDALRSQNKNFKGTAKAISELKVYELDHVKVQQVQRIISLLNRMNLGDLTEDPDVENPPIQQIGLFILNLHGILLPEEVVRQGMDNNRPEIFTSGFLLLNLMIAQGLTKIRDKVSAGILEKITNKDILTHVKTFL
jgi:hypothetical protein